MHGERRQWIQKHFSIIVSIVAALSAAIMATPVMARNMTGENMTGGNRTEVGCPVSAEGIALCPEDDGQGKHP